MDIECAGKRKINPKRMQREVNSRLENKGIGIRDDINFLFLRNLLYNLSVIVSVIHKNICGIYKKCRAITKNERRKK